MASHSVTDAGASTTATHAGNGQFMALIKFRNSKHSSHGSVNVRLKQMSFEFSFIRLNRLLLSHQRRSSSINRRSWSDVRCQ